MSEGSFKQVNNSDGKIYGPRALLVCGFAPADQEIFLEMVDENGIQPLPVVFVVETQLETTLEKLVKAEHKSGYSLPSEMAQAVIISGITEKELHHIINGYKRLGLPFPLWATLTPVSEKWILRDLLRELEKEREAFRKRKQS